MSRTTLRLQALEARNVPSGSQLFAVAEDSGLSRVAVYQAGGEQIIANDVFDGSGAAIGPDYVSQKGALLTTFTPFPGFRGGVRVAVGDVTGDGVDDVVCAAGYGGGPHVKVYDGGELLSGRATRVKEFFAFDDRFKGGLYVAVGQMNPETPQKEIIVGAGESGGPHVKVFALTPIVFTQMLPPPEDYLSLQQTSEFFAYDKNFRGGVRVTAGDVNGDGRDDIVTGAGPGGGPHVRVFDVYPPNPLALYPAPFALLDEFFAYGSDFHGGVYVAAGNVTGNSQYAEVVTGAGEGGGPHMKVFSREATGKLTKSAEAFVGSPSLISGVRVGLADLGNDGSAAPSSRPFTIYTGTGYDPAAVTIPEIESRLGAFNFHFGPLRRVALDIFPLGGDGALNVG